MLRDRTPLINSSSCEIAQRYADTPKSKAEGVTYTPRNLSDFVASQVVRYSHFPCQSGIRLRILEPSLGNGQLVLSLLEAIKSYPVSGVDVFGFEIDEDAIRSATESINRQYPTVELHLIRGNFLEYVTNQFGVKDNSRFEATQPLEPFDLVIANPPYVRTQILGANQAQLLARQFNLNGRVDLYYAFLLGIGRVLKPSGTAGIIVSNRFMMTKAGNSVRKGVLEQVTIRHIWDLGDTKLFDVAVLPCVLILEGKHDHNVENKGTQARFTSIYETCQPVQSQTHDVISALMLSGVVGIEDGRRFLVTQGNLDTGTFSGDVWRITTTSSDRWLKTVEQNTYAKFADIGKVRVGVKTTADKVFIRSDWHQMTDDDRPELLRPIITHQVARRYKPLLVDHTKILYPYEVKDGKRTLINLENFPKTKSYLEKHREILESRKYIREAGRQWYEIWVPQDPEAWSKPKLVTRDISEQPMFWIDLNACVVNGDCYWLTSDRQNNDDLLWIALAVGNSKFIEVFYDHRFHNQLYSGRRRFITQYVEEFPLPRPDTIHGQEIIALTKQLYSLIPSAEIKPLEAELDLKVWQAFGLDTKEVSR